MTRITPTTPMKARTSANIRKLAADVARTFPDMSVHDHLIDAARELDGGRIDGSKRHLNAAIEGFAPLQITRHGVHDDEGHRTAKLYMQQAYRHLLNVRDIEDVRQRNEGMLEQKRAEAAAASGKTFLPSSQPIPVGAPNGAAGPVASPAAVAPQAQGLKALSWEDITDAIELVGKGGWSHGWVRALNVGASVPPEGGNAVPLEVRSLPAKHQAVYKKMRAKGHSHGRAMTMLGKIGSATGKALNVGGSVPPMSNEGVIAAVELVGPKGYTHNWVYHGRPGASPEDRANELSHYLAHHKLSGENRHQAHLEATRRHNYAAGLSSVPAVSARHQKLARFHAKVAQQARVPARRAFGPSLADREAQNPDFNIGKFTHDLPIGSATSYRVRQLIAAGKAGPRPATIQASWEDILGAIELTGPKGYSHGWVYHGTPKTRAAMIAHIAHGHGAGLPTGRTGYQKETRTYEDFAAEHEALHHAHPGQTHTHELPVTAKTYRKADNPVRDFEALASMPPFTPAQQHTMGIADPDYYKKIRAGIMATIQASWEDVDRAIELSADTGRLASEPHPFGKPGGPGLWGVKGMELPPYIQNIARALLRTGRAKTLSQAIAIARGASKRWAAGGGNVRPEVRAASAATDASWRSKQARAHAHANTGVTHITLAGFNPAEPRTPVGTWGAGGAAAGKGMTKQQLQQQVKADRIKLKALQAELSKLTTIKHKTTAAAQKAAATGKTAKATPAKKGAPAKRGPAGRKAPTRAQQITSIRGQIKKLVLQIAADQKRIAALSNPLDGILLAS
jgi:hypothetical protein